MVYSSAPTIYNVLSGVQFRTYNIQCTIWCKVPHLQYTMYYLVYSSAPTIYNIYYLVNSSAPTIYNVYYLVNSSAPTIYNIYYLVNSFAPTIYNILSGVQFRTYNIQYTIWCTVPHLQYTMYHLVYSSAPTIYNAYYLVHSENRKTPMLWFYGWQYSWHDLCYTL